MLTPERATKLANYLNKDTQQTKVLFEMEPADAVLSINSEGYDFTEEELIEFASEVSKVLNITHGAGELDESALENVSGGIGWVVVGLVLGGATALGVWNGYHVTKWANKGK